MNELKFNKILLTGIAGFIGFHTTKKLADLGYEVTGLDNINDYYDVNLKFARLEELGLPKKEAEQFGKTVKSDKYKNLTFIRLNLEDRGAVSGLFEAGKFDAVIHLAAQPGVRYSLENPHAYIDSNIVGFMNILEGCRHHKTGHLVYASSSSVYGENAKIPFSEDDRVDHPVSLYAATKKSNELMAYTYSHLFGIPTSGLRFFTVYGPWGRPDMAPMLFAKAISEDKPINVFNHGDMSRDFTYIDDIVAGILLTLQNPPTPTPMSAPMPEALEGEGAKNSEQTKALEDQGAKNSSPMPADSRASGIGTGADPLTTAADGQTSANYQLFNIGNGSPVALMHFIETLEKEMGKTAKKIMREMQPGDVPRTWADTAKLNALGYQSTTPIEEGVKEFVRWFEEYLKV